MQGRLLAVSIAALALSTMTGPVLAQEYEGGGQAVFRAGVDLVTVSATVRDRKGRLVSALEARDFEVVDSGERRAINQFRTDRAPLSLAILFDVSGSMDVAERMTAARFAAHHLLSWLEPGRDEAALFPGYRFRHGGHEFCAMVFPERGRGNAPLSAVDGRPMRRATPRPRPTTATPPSSGRATSPTNRPSCL